jgi:asparagine synthase (glutamine-hydrolysing)
VSPAPFVARVAPDAGHIESAKRLGAGVAERGPIAVHAVPGLEIARNAPADSELPGSPRTVCLIDGRVDGMELLADELGREANGETLLAHAYEVLGEAVLSRVHGPFVALLWDRDRRRGIVVRDQLGGRPLFFCDRGSEQFVASEIRDLIASSVTAPKPDRVSVAHWLARQTPPGDRTLFAGISRLQAGRLIRVGAARVTARRWWEPAYREPVAISRSEAVAELRNAMSESVDRALRSARAPGLMLSGGLDSSSIAGLMRAAGHQARVYSGVFPTHPRVDESARIQLLAERLGIEVEQVVFGGGSALSAAADYIERWALPPSSPNWFVWEPLYELARAEGVDLMIDGEGGDELFGCSPRLLADLLLAGRLRRLVDQARQVPGMGPEPKRRWVMRAISQYAVRGALPPGLHARARTLRHRRRGPAWLSPEARDVLELGSGVDAWKRLGGPRWWASLAFSVVDGPDRMAAQDEAGRAGGLSGFDVAHPWRDLRLVEFVLSLPAELAFDPDLDRPLARAAVRDLIPDEVRLFEHKPFFNDLLDDALAATDAGELERTLHHPSEALAWALAPAALNAVEGRARPLLAWRIATANLWARRVFG